MTAKAKYPSKRGPMTGERRENARLRGKLVDANQRIHDLELELEIMARDNEALKITVDSLIEDLRAAQQKAET